MQALKQQFTAQLPALLKDLQQAFANTDWHSLAYAAHSLKGSAGSMGYPLLTELAGQLEVSARQQLSEACAALLRQMQQSIAKDDE